ncbi:MAG: O-antigen ligase family protein [Bacteroidota bacterium]
MKYNATPTSQWPVWLTPVNLAWFMVFAMMAVLNISKAIVSISMGGLAFAAVWEVIRSRRIKLHYDIPSTFLKVGLFLLAVVALIWTENQAGWIKDIREKLPFLALPLGLALLPRFSSRQKQSVFLVFVMSQSIVAAISLIRFLIDYDQVIYNISKNGNIDIIGSISHIYFGLFLSFSIFLGGYLFLSYRREWPKWLLIICGLCTLFNFLALHVITSRTGLLAFYGAASCGIFWWMFRKAKWWQGLTFFLVMAMLPVVAYQILPTFKNRVDVTLWDLQESQNPNRDLADLSAGMRLITWNTSFEVWRQHPWMGVGKGDLKVEMGKVYEEKGYADRSSHLFSDPHNQYLMVAASFGIMGLLIFGCLFVREFFIWRRDQVIFLLFISLILIGMIFESILNRQVGMTFFIIFSMLIPRS